MTQVHQAPPGAAWRYLFLDGVRLRGRRPSDRKRGPRLVAYGVRPDGTRHLLAFPRSQGESQAAWEGLLQDLYRRGLAGQARWLIVTDGWPGLAAALPIVSPRVPHQRGWVHKLRNLVGAVRRRDQKAVAMAARAIYQAASRHGAEAQARAFARCRQKAYPALVRRLLADLPELRAFSQCPPALWRKVRTTNVIRTRRCGGPAPDPPDGRFCQCAEREAHHFFHL